MPPDAFSWPHHSLVLIELEIHESRVIGNLPRCHRYGCMVIPGKPRFTRLRIFSTRRDFYLRGKCLRNSSLGMSARTARTKTADWYRARSATIARLKPYFFGSIGMGMAD